MSSSRGVEVEELERREEKGQYNQLEQQVQKQQEGLQQQEEDLELQEEVAVEHRGEKDLEEEEDVEHREEDVERQEEEVEHQEEDAERRDEDVESRVEDSERQEEEAEHREEDVESREQDAELREEDRKDEKRETSHSETTKQEHTKAQDDAKLENMKVEILEVVKDGDKRQAEPKEQSSNEAGKLDSSQLQQQSPQLPPLRSYVMAKRSGKIRQQQQQQLAPNRVMLEAAKLLPRLRHSQPGIGYYRRVRGPAAGRSVDLWSSQEPTGQPCSLVIGPSQELTSQFYSKSDNKQKSDQQSGVKSIITAASVNGHYPFSRVVYPNVIGQRVRQSSSVAQAQQQRRSHTLHCGEGTFVLRHKLRQSAGCLARIMDSSSTGEAAVRRTISRTK